MCVCVCIHIYIYYPGGRVIKNLPANAGDARDVGLIPRLGRFLGVGNPGTQMATHSSILVWKIPQTQESGGL